MDIDQLRVRFPGEQACREFFESIIWQDGRRFPHCDYEKSYRLLGQSSWPDLYECGLCKRQFTVTTKTPMQAPTHPYGNA